MGLLGWLRLLAVAGDTPDFLCINCAIFFLSFLHNLAGIPEAAAQPEIKAIRREGRQKKTTVL